MTRAFPLMDARHREEAVLGDDPEHVEPRRITAFQEASSQICAPEAIVARHLLSVGRARASPGGS